MSPYIKQNTGDNQVYNLYLATAPDQAYPQMLYLSSQKHLLPAGLPC